MNIKNTKPTLFEKSACNIWTDPYIQQQMLKAHLDQSTDGASRKMDSIYKVVDYIKGIVCPGTHILDLGCGPGLYAGILRDAGYQITGIDFNKASIDYAVSCSKDINYIQGDYIREYPEGHFDAVMMIYCDMGTYSDQERDVLLDKIYHSLVDGGKLIFDVFTEKLIEDRTENQHWEYVSSGGFWSESDYLLLSQTFHYPEEKCFACQYNLLTDNETKHIIVWDRYYGEGEICELLGKIGFKDIKISTGVLGDNDFTSSNEMFVVAEK